MGRSERIALHIWLCHTCNDKPGSNHLCYIIHITMYDSNVIASLSQCLYRLCMHTVQLSMNMHPGVDSAATLSRCINRDPPAIYWYYSYSPNRCTSPSALRYDHSRPVRLRTAPT
jgi:hypothetical protein